MTLHVFNPEHDIALAADLENFTAPHAGRQLRHDLGFLPVLWAKEGDKVLVDDLEMAQKNISRLASRLPQSQCAALLAKADFLVTGRRFCRSGQTMLQFGLDGAMVRPEWPGGSGLIVKVDPWGWNRALRAQLQRMGFPLASMPSDLQLNNIRSLSHRRLSAAILPRIHQQLGQWQDQLVGQSWECQSRETVESLLSEWPQLVLKAPWSSSGRGLRFVTDLTPQTGWLNNLLKRQGSVMVEPYYNKVKDFGMEFEAHPDGSVSYLGLSLFHTANGAYTGNLLATESVKLSMINRYLSADLLLGVQQSLCDLLGHFLKGRYCGPLGVDMMIVAREGSDGFSLHPCVEINLRRTMGHVALSLGRLVNPDADDELVRVMRIVYEDNIYKLKIQRL